MKIKVFAWLLFFDRLNTKDLLVRRHWRSDQENNLCVLCCMFMRIGCIYSSPATSVSESGITFKWTGSKALTCNNVYPRLGGTLDTLSSWKWFLLQHGIFGF